MMPTKISMTQTVQKERKKPTICSMSMKRPPSLLQVLVAGLAEIDQRAKHLQVSDQGVQFRDLARRRVELSDHGLGIALLEGGGGVGVRPDLRFHVGQGI